ncbi:MAG: SagB/ThcOx family dehydrogenase [Verrucomicrobiia bacterium]
MHTERQESAVAAVVTYHEQTEHRLERYARSLGYMKWEDQPNSFRGFHGAPHIILPLTGKDQPPSFSDLFSSASRTAQPLNAQTLGQFFQFSLALSAWKETPSARWSLRINPSSGNLHPTEAYALLPPVDGVGCSCGAYHYLSRDHSLEWRTRWEGASTGGFYVALTSIPWRESWKYGERAFRYCQHDVGHALAAISFSAAILGWKTKLQPVAAEYLDWLLGLTTPSHPLEMEIPEALVSIQVGSSRGPFRLPEADLSIDLFGSPNRLSAGHTAWPLIDEVAALTRNPGELISAASRSGPRWPSPNPVPCSAPATRIIHQRRSALDFDGDTPLSRELLFQMLDQTLPRPQIPPLGIWELPVSVHLALLVHRVTGLRPGLYLYVRDLEQLNALRESLDPDFLWECEEPLERPLFKLKEADVRSFAKTVSCHQDIAADGAFSLGMLARFGPVLRERGPHAYRELFWETGIIGQCLYLAAEAAGMRGTGIGCYFDDVMHDALGLRDRTWQSLYHFTIGAPVDDPRLRSAPAYPDRR